MKISVVIPACNEAETIGEVIDNVQNYADEIIVVGDGGVRIGRRKSLS